MSDVNKKDTENLFKLIDDNFEEIIGNELYVDSAIQSLVVRANWSDIDYFKAVEYIAKIFPDNLVEQLWQLVNGPVFDGDVISKNHRDRLFDMKIGISVCKDGKDGYNGSKNIGYSILKELDELN